MFTVTIIANQGSQHRASDADLVQLGGWGAVSEVCELDIMSVLGRGLGLGSDNSPWKLYASQENRQLSK